MSDHFKYSDEDFKNKSTIDAMAEKYNLSNYNISDDNGYTPLCYIALNGLRPDLIVYLVNNKSADASKVCDKGSTPLELACMSGNAEAVTALIGGSVVERDEDGNIIYTSSLKPDQPKKDAAGNPIPKRDSEDNVIYEKDDCGTPYPLGYKEDPDNVASVKPEIQYAEYKTEEDPFDKGKVVVKSVRRVPPLSTKSVIYKYEKDGSHTPMRDIDGKPLKQYNKDSLQPINKKDEVTFKPIRNKYEYIWDYESQPEYETAYEESFVNALSYASISPKDIFQASSNKDSSILIALSGNNSSGSPLYIGKWDASDEDTTFSDNYESPLIAACRMQALDSVKIILGKLANPIKVLDAINHHTKELSGISETAYTISSNLKDVTLFKAFEDHIPNINDVINKVIDGKLYKILNDFKGVGEDSGEFTDGTVDIVYDSIDDDTLIIGTDEYTSLLESKWPARD